jgi:hypothetical protein
MWGRSLSRNLADMHTLNARVIVAQLIEERIDNASRARRFGRRRFTRGERRAAPSSPIPGRLRVSGAGR